jgi:nitrate reductase delta subunit
MRLWEIFADILEYPTPQLGKQVDECLSLLLPDQEEAAACLGQFRDFLGQTAAGRVEEIYTSTFDLQPVCYPYAGYHLFGENHRRGSFMAQLKEQYRIRNFSPVGELPDHIAVLLRFLAHLEEDEERKELIHLVMVPTLQRMLEGLKDGKNPYRALLQALLILLEKARRQIG